MNKLIFLVCHVFLASLLLVVSPAQASTRWKTAPIAHEIVAASVQPIPELTVPILTQPHHQIANKTGCGCSACVKANFQMLQGKLPAAGF
ncbi:MAG: hypothetical protein RLZZ507_4040 [Cyanobacteriota bacterium]|jgi:hypothetical protein